MTRRLQEAADELAAFRERKGDTTDAPSLFDTIAAVIESAGEVWKLEVLEAIVAVAKRKPTLTVEDLDGLVPPTIDLRALGGVMLEAQRRGYIRKGQWVTSGRERHGRPVRQWISLIHRGGDGGAA